MRNIRQIKMTYDTKEYNKWWKEHPLIFPDEHNLLVRFKIKLFTFTDYKMLDRLFMKNRILNKEIHSMVYYKEPVYPCDIVRPCAKTDVNYA